MPIFMLHFDCTSEDTGASKRNKAADVCVISDSVEQAEALGREAIGNHQYQAGSLIAYNTIDKAAVAKLDEYETILYLKALKNKPPVAVMFT
jgi:hypothetical protein